MLHTSYKNMITKIEQAEQREFKGVSLDVLAIGEKSMVTKMNYVKGDYASTHAHPNEQSGYIITGKYRLKIETLDMELSPGDSYTIPENNPHSFKDIEEEEVIYVFTTISTEYF